MKIRNITFAGIGDGDASVTSSSSLVTGDQSTDDCRLRLRTVAVSPHEEYQLRPGSVRPISNELHAAILSRKGRVKITTRGVVVDREDMGGANVYWHEDSVLCNDLGARERRIFYVVNPHQPDIVHLLADDGSYIESLPRKSKPEVLNVEQQQAEIAKQNRFISRVQKRLQDLHGKETADKLRDLQANSIEMQRVVQTLPAPEAAGRTAPAPAAGAARMAARGAERIETLRSFRASALAMGRAVSLSRPSDRSDPSDPSDSAEDWRDTTLPKHSRQQPQAPVEQW